MPPKKTGIKKFFLTEAITNSASNASADEEDSSSEANTLDREFVNDEEQDETLGHRSTGKSTKITKAKAAPTVNKKLTEKVDNSISSTKARTKKVSPSFKDPGDVSYPVSTWSLTITRTGEDVPIELMDIMEEFLKSFCIKGGIATEVGSRIHMLHIQGVFSLRYPTTAPFKAQLSK